MCCELRHIYHNTEPFTPIRSSFKIH